MIEAGPVRFGKMGGGHGTQLKWFQKALKVRPSLEIGNIVESVVQCSLFILEKRALMGMGMPQRIMNDIIEATQQERQRIEEPKNRSRYFIFGKIDERLGKNGYSVRFENVPDRVLRDAVWATRQGTPSLFKVGDVFIPEPWKSHPGGYMYPFLRMRSIAWT